MELLKLDTIHTVLLCLNGHEALRVGLSCKDLRSVLIDNPLTTTAACQFLWNAFCLQEFGEQACLAHSSSSSI